MSGVALLAAIWFVEDSFKLTLKYSDLRDRFISDNIRKNDKIRKK